jgi:hypothetical protein
VQEYKLAARKALAAACQHSVPFKQAKRTMVRIVAALLVAFASSCDGLAATRRGLINSAAIGAIGAATALTPAAALASGVSLEEAAKNAEKYRVKGKQCTPTNPADCTARYNQMLDPRAGRTKEELAAMDRRDAKELSMLETMLSDVKYESTGKGK